MQWYCLLSFKGLVWSGLTARCKQSTFVMYVHIHLSIIVVSSIMYIHHSRFVAQCVVILATMLEQRQTPDPLHQRHLQIPCTPRFSQRRIRTRIPFWRQRYQTIITHLWPLQPQPLHPLHCTTLCTSRPPSTSQTNHPQLSHRRHHDIQPRDQRTNFTRQQRHVENQ